MSMCPFACQNHSQLGKRQRLCPKGIAPGSGEYARAAYGMRIYNGFTKATQMAQLSQPVIWRFMRTYMRRRTTLAPIVNFNKEIEETAMPRELLSCTDDGEVVIEYGVPNVDDEKMQS